VLDLAKRVSIKTDEELNRAYPEKTSSRVEIALKDGRTLVRQTDISKGDPRDPMEADDLAAKLHRFAGKREAAKLDRIIDMVMEIEKLRYIKGLARIIYRKLTAETGDGMDFTLSEEQNMLVETLRTMGERENFRELAKKIDETCEFPFELMDRYAEMGLLGMTISPEYGGGGQPAVTSTTSASTAPRRRRSATYRRVSAASGSAAWP